MSFVKDTAIVKIQSHRKRKAAKIELREKALEAIGPERASVFDAFAGSGEMYRAVWHKAAAYVGCDLEWSRDDRLAFVADNRRVLRLLDLSGFNVFDLDAHGSPWTQAIIIAARRSLKPGERIALCLTEGSGLKIKQGGLPDALAELAGVQGKLSGLFRWRADLVDRALANLAGRLKGSIERRWEAEDRGTSGMLYVTALIKGRGDGPRDNGGPTNRPAAARRQRAPSTA